MEVVASVGNKDIAMVYVLNFNGQLVECVEAVQPPIPRSEKWVLMISTLYGCPVGCQFCDAGGHYRGPVSKMEMKQQIEYLISTRYPSGRVPSKQFKIQFARMGEPSFNPAVLDLLAELPAKLEAPGLMPSLSTIAPHGRDEFFDRLIEIKEAHYAGGRFQMQFSIHTTSSKLRDEMLPVRKWNFAQIADFGHRYFQPDDRKITLNFALAQGSPIDPAQLREYFEPDKFLVKLTPLNPTYRAEMSGLKTYINGRTSDDNSRLIKSLERVGFQVIVSIGELEENEIGSNCGQYVLQHINQQEELSSGYSYPVLNISQALGSKD